MTFKFGQISIDPVALLAQRIALLSTTTLELKVDERVTLPLAIARRLGRKTQIVGECWEWMGYRKQPAGYGCITHEHHDYFIHRIAYAVFHRPIDTDQLVCHRCDNPPCWNPEHLFMGDQIDNIMDMRAKNRAVDPPIHAGETHPKATLTDVQVASLRTAAASKRFSQRAIAKAFGVSQSTVWRLVHEETRAEAQ